MKCPKCGTENGDTSKYCKKCGVPLSMSKPKPNRFKCIVIITIILLCIFVSVFMAIHITNKKNRLPFTDLTLKTTVDDIKKEYGDLATEYEKGSSELGSLLLTIPWEYNGIKGYQRVYYLRVNGKNMICYISLESNEATKDFIEEIISETNKRFGEADSFVADYYTYVNWPSGIAELTYGNIDDIYEFEIRYFKEESLDYLRSLKDESNSEQEENNKSNEIKKDDDLKTDDEEVFTEESNNTVDNNENKGLDYSDGSVPIEYKEFLSDLLNEGSLAYTLIYVNENSKPELVILNPNDNSSVSSAGIYTTDNGEVELIGFFGTFGGYFTYYPMKNLIYSDETSTGYHYEYYTSFNGHNVNRIEFQTDVDYADGTCTYYSGSYPMDGTNFVYPRIGGGKEIGTSDYEKIVQDIFDGIDKSTEQYIDIGSCKQIHNISEIEFY